MVEHEAFVFIPTQKHEGFSVSSHFFDHTAAVIGAQDRLAETQQFLHKKRVADRDGAFDLKKATSVETAFVLRTMAREVLALQEKSALVYEKGAAMDILKEEEANLAFRLLLARRSIDFAKPGGSDLASNMHVRVYTHTSDEMFHPFSANYIEIGVPHPVQRGETVRVKSRIPDIVSELTAATGFDATDNTVVIRGLVQGNNAKPVEEGRDAFAYRRGLEMQHIDAHRTYNDTDTLRSAHALKTSLAFDLLSLWLERKSGKEGDEWSTGIRVGVVKSERNGTPEKLQFSVTAGDEKFVSRISAPWLPTKGKTVDRLRRLLQLYPDVQWDYSITERLY